MVEDAGNSTELRAIFGGSAHLKPPPIQTIAQPEPTPPEPEPTPPYGEWTTRDQQRRHGDGMEDPPTHGGVTATYIRNSDKMYVYSRRVDKFVWIRRLPYVAVRTPELGGRSPAQ
ncbi:unnamed protein product [Boreogadus saida]